MFNKSSAAMTYSEIASVIAFVISVLKQLCNCSERWLASVFPDESDFQSSNNKGYALGYKD